MDSMIKQSATTSTAHIFLIDDEEIVLETFSAYLRDQGFLNLHQFSSATDAISMLRCLRPDLILTDIHMPDISGNVLTGLVREFEHLREIPLIAVTADERTSTVDEVLAQGADAVLLKPVTDHELITAVESFVGS